jgi:DNA-binding response OmpR family regulator
MGKLFHTHINLFYAEICQKTSEVAGGISIISKQSLFSLSYILAMPNVLIVDDDVDLLEMVTLALTVNNMTVRAINKGQLLFDSLAAEKPDIILMDIYLGETDGRVLCLSLKNKEQYRNIPVILYSAGHITASSVHESQADDFITKPFDITQLVNKIHSVLPS